MEQLNYSNIRHTLLPGDLVAFGGTGAVSNVIKLGTGSNVSHVETVFRSFFTNNIPTIQLMGSVSLGYGFAGVQLSRMSARVKMYDGDVWVLRMRSDIHIDFSEKAFTAWMLAQEGKQYDAPGAVAAGIPLIPVGEDFSKMFCSELISGGLQEAGVIPKMVNASRETPIEVCEYDIWEEPVQIRGYPKNLR